MYFLIGVGRIRKENMKARLIVALSLLICAISFIQIRRLARDHVHIIKKVPRFEGVDLRGNRIKYDQLIGKPSFIQFINPLAPDEIELFRLVCVNWQKENVNIVAFTENPDRLISESGTIDQGTIIVSRDYDNIIKKFRLPPPYRAYFVADAHGRIVAFGSERNAYQETVKVELQRLVKGKEFSIADFITKGSNIHKSDWLDQLSHIVDNGSNEYYVFSLFTKICDSCRGGSAIRDLKQIYSRQTNMLQVVAILLNTYNQEDIVNLKSQLSISFPVIIADVRLSKKWAFFINEFRENDLTDILFVVRRTGEILDVADRKCRCRADLLKGIMQLSQSEAGLAR
jgi:hypothetical protein